MSITTKVLEALISLEPDAANKVTENAGTNWQEEADKETTIVTTVLEKKLVPLGYANVNSNGTLSSSFGEGVTSKRTASGRYTLTPPKGALTCSCNVVDTSTRDSIEIHPMNFTGTMIQIHEGDNGTAANIFIDRSFSIIWYGVEPVLTNIT